jgi:hypothetical protein
MDAAHIAFWVVWSVNPEVIWLWLDQTKPLGCSARNPGISATSPDERGRWSSGDSDSPPVALRRTWREYGHAARTRRNFRQVANDPTFQEVDWHRVWKGEFGMPTTKVKKSKSK